MMIETGFLLLEDARSKSKSSSGSDSSGRPIGLPQQAGFLTPAAAFGYRLVDQLKECEGFSFIIKKFVPAS